MKFLIVKLSSLGDIIHTLPLVYKLRESFPEAQIDWLVGNKGFDFLNLIKELNNVYLLNLSNVLFVRKQKYDFVIDVQGLFKSAFLSKMLLGKKIIGFKNTREFADIFYDEKINAGNLFNTKSHIVDLNLKLISSFVKKETASVKFLIPEIDKPDNKNISMIIDRNQNSSILPSIVVFPGTTWKSKLWPMNYWFELLSSISKSHRLYVCASSNDLKYTQELVDMLDLNKVPYENLIGKTSIKDLIYLIQNIDIVVGLDSAPLHLASAIKNDYGSPEIVGIYGPTSPIRSGPYKVTQNCLYLSELECIACRKKQCPLGHHNCMNNIIPLYVKDMICSKPGKYLEV